MSSPNSYPTIDYEDVNGRVHFPTSNLPITTAVDAVVLTATDLLNEIITHSVTTDKSLTLPDAATLIAELDVFGDVSVASAIDFSIIATPGFTTTIVTGSGGTIIGGADVTESALYRLIITSLVVGSESYQLIRLSGGKPEFNVCPEIFTTATNATALSATDNLRGVIIHDITTNLSLQLDTAANLLTAFGPTSQVGSYTDFTITTTAGLITTVATGTGGTLVGSDNVDGSGRFRIQFTNVSTTTETYNLIRLASNAPTTATLPAPVAITAANPGALTTADILAKNVFYTASSSQSATLPTANQIVAALGGNGIPIGTFVKFTVIATRGFVLRIFAGTNGTLLGSDRVEYSGSFTIIVTDSGAATETYQVIREDSGEQALEFCSTPITSTPINKTPLASSDILSEVISYDADENTTAQMPAASTLLTAIQSFRGHPLDLNSSLEFTIVATPGYKLTIGTTDPSVTALGSMSLDDSATFKIIFTNVTGASEAYTILRLSGGDPNLQFCAAPVTTATNGPMTAAEMVSGTILFDQTSDQTESFPTPSSLITELAAAGQAADVGSCIDFTVVTTSPFSVTFTAPVNVTLNGSGFITSSGSFRAILTSVGPDQYVVTRKDFSSPATSPITFTSKTDADHNPITSAELLSGVILQTVNSADRTLTLDTASNLVAASSPSVGEAVEFTVIGTEQFRSTVAVAAGGTLNGSGVVASSGSFKLIFTNVTATTEAYELVRLDHGGVDLFPRSSDTIAALADADVVLTAAQVVGDRFIRQATLTADRVLTLPSAAAIKTEMGDVVDGTSIDFTIVTDQPYRATIAVGAGGTLYGSTVVKNSASFVLVLTTNGTAYNVFRLDSDDSDFSRTTSAILTTAAGSLTGAELAGNRVINHSPLTADTINTLTLPDTATIAAAMATTAIGSSFEVTFVTDPTAQTQIVLDAEGTLVGGSLISSSASFRVVLTGAATYDVIRLSASTNTTMTPTTSAAAAFAPTVAQVLTGFISHTASAAGATETITLPTAALLVAGTPDALIGTTLDVVVTAIDGPKQVIAGASGTLITGHNDIVAHASAGVFRVRFTNVTAASEAYDLFRVGSGSAPLPLTIAPAAVKDITGGVTLTVPEIQAGLVSFNAGGPDTATLPTAVAIDTATGLFTVPGSTIDFSVINDAGSGGTVTVAVGTGGTANAESVLGVAVGTSGQFRLRMTSTTTYDLFRIA